MSTNYKRFNYRVFTDYWVIIVIGLFYASLYFNFLPEYFNDFYTLLFLALIKMFWTKTSNIKLYKDMIIFHHKELATYQRPQVIASDIKQIIFKTFSMTFGESEYCMIMKKSSQDKDILINLSRFSRPKEVKNEIREFAKKNTIKVRSF